MSSTLSRFVPISATELAEAASDAHRGATLAFLGDARLEPTSAGEFTLVHTPGCAVPGRIEGSVDAAAHRVVARAVRSDGALLDVALTPQSAVAHASVPVGVFVYGTLMHGEERAGAIRSVLPHATPADGWIHGDLVHLGAWPGLVNGPGRVHGELFTTSDLVPLLAVLDPIEDFTDFHATPTEYVRVVLPVHTASGVAWAWTYRYVGDTSGAIPIPSGRWRDVPRRLPGTEGMRRRSDAV